MNSELATYIPTDFKTEDNKSNRAIDALVAAYKHSGLATIKVLPGKNTVKYDLEISFAAHPEDVYACEMKTNAGASANGYQYPTWIIETFSDNAKTKPTDWRTADSLDYLIICNGATKQGFVYHVDKLREYVSANIDRQQPSGTGTGQYHVNDQNKKCSWGLKINWACKDAGYIKTVDLSRFWA